MKRVFSKPYKKTHLSNFGVGPLLPLLVLVTLYVFHNGWLSSEQEFSNQCNRISKVTREVANSGLGETISLGDDSDMLLNIDLHKEKKGFIAYFCPITEKACSEQTIARTHYFYWDLPLPNEIGNSKLVLKMHCMCLCSHCYFLGYYV
ncbi:predicted protein [Arabidopsis lyrata subsp. lyrata]|uniref:Predicted protein n=1 Tax=Arabidopsis lyrata subsp. lyrata TaxID=81972 RepID=D7LCX8_ARALL|nr:predicted protein [Arabidopsis lyrata subsp. lyrata]